MKRDMSMIERYAVPGATITDQRGTWQRSVTLHTGWIACPDCRGHVVTLVTVSEYLTGRAHPRADILALCPGRGPCKYSLPNQPEEVCGVRHTREHLAEVLQHATDESYNRRRLVATFRRHAADFDPAEWLRLLAVIT